MDMLVVRLVSRVRPLFGTTLAYAQLPVELIDLLLHELLVAEHLLNQIRIYGYSSLAVSVSGEGYRGW